MLAAAGVLLAAAGVVLAAAPAVMPGLGTHVGTDPATAPFVGPVRLVEGVRDRMGDAA